MGLFVNKRKHYLNNFDDNCYELKDIVYDYIYDNIVDYCVTAIENGNYEEAYARYKGN